MDSKNIETKDIVKRYDIEEALAKLLFYIEASIKTKEYISFKKSLEELLVIVKNWFDYYISDGDLHRVTDKEAKDAINLCDSIAGTTAYSKVYYEYLEAWLNVTIYYSSCPINQEFDKNSIKRKGNI